MIKVSKEITQNNNRQYLSNKRNKVNQKLNSKFKKIAPTYIVVKDFGTPIVISETNLKIKQTATCNNNGANNKTLDTTLQEDKTSIESMVHKLIAQLDQLTEV